MAERPRTCNRASIAAVERNTLHPENHLEHLAVRTKKRKRPLDPGLIPRRHQHLETVIGDAARQCVELGSSFNFKTDVCAGASFPGAKDELVVTGPAG